MSKSKILIFHCTLMDILKPLTVFDPGTFKNLRDRPEKVFESRVLVFAYSVTYLVNCQVKKLHGRSGIPEEITRLTADGLSNNQVESLNVQYQIYAQNEIIFISCPVGGRNVLGYHKRFWGPFLGVAESFFFF